MTDQRDALASLIATEVARPIPAEVRALAQTLRDDMGANVAAILFYGSGLECETDARDAIVYDLYVLVDAYRPALGSVALAAANRILPPSVFYREIAHEGRVVRCKYAVMRLRQFMRAAGRRAASPLIWSRFAQATRLAHARDDAARAAVLSALTRAAITFHARTLPLLAGRVTAEEVWRRGLSESYACDLRAERAGHAKRLFARARAYHAAVTRLAAPLSGVPVRIESGAALSVTPHRAQAMGARAARLWRRPVGKLLTLLRLIKSAFTFSGAVDYVLWKIERHSGVHVDATPWQRRHPLLGCWGIAWRLYRAGAFR